LLLEVGEFGVERLGRPPAAIQIVPPPVAEKLQHAAGGWSPTEAVLGIERQGGKAGGLQG